MCGDHLTRKIGIIEKYWNFISLLGFNINIAAVCLISFIVRRVFQLPICIDGCSCRCWQKVVSMSSGGQYGEICELRVVERGLNYPIDLADLSAGRLESSINHTAINWRLVNERSHLSSIMHSLVGPREVRPQDRVIPQE
jgi:hypothetical protein